MIGLVLLCRLRHGLLFHCVNTVPTLNSCTKCVGSLGIIHDRTPICHPVFCGMNAYMTSWLNIAFIRLAFLTCYLYILYNQELADVRSTVTSVCTAEVGDMRIYRVSGIVQTLPPTVFPLTVTPSRRYLSQKIGSQIGIPFLVQRIARMSRTLNSVEQWNYKDWFLIRRLIWR